MSISLLPSLHDLHTAFQITQSGVHCEAEPQPMRTSQAPPCIGDKRQESILAIHVFCWSWHAIFTKQKCFARFFLFCSYVSSWNTKNILSKQVFGDGMLSLNMHIQEYLRKGTSVPNKVLRERESFCILSVLLSRKIASEHYLRTGLQEIPW